MPPLVPVPNDARRPSGGALDIGTIAGAHELEVSVGGHDAHVSRGSADREENTLPAPIGTIELKVFHDSFMSITS
jgi:hypothetical protein